MKQPICSSTPASPRLDLAVHQQPLGKIQVNGVTYNVKVIGGIIPEAQLGQTMDKVYAIAKTILGTATDATRVDITKSAATIYKSETDQRNQDMDVNVLDTKDLGTSKYQVAGSSWQATENDALSQSIGRTLTPLKCSDLFRSIFTGSTTTTSSSFPGSAGSSTHLPVSGATERSIQPHKAEDHSSSLKTSASPSIPSRAPNSSSLASDLTQTSSSSSSHSSSLITPSRQAPSLTSSTSGPQQPAISHHQEASSPSGSVAESAEVSLDLVEEAEIDSDAVPEEAHRHSSDESHAIEPTIGDRSEALIASAALTQNPPASDSSTLQQPQAISHHQEASSPSGSVPEPAEVSLDHVDEPGSDAPSEFQHLTEEQEHAPQEPAMSPPDSLDASQAVEASHEAREEDRSRDSSILQQPQAVSADGGALSSSESASEPESQSEQQEGARGKPATSPLQPSAAAASSSSSSASLAQSEALAQINQALKGLPIEEFCFAAQRSFEIEDKAEKVRTLRPVSMSQLSEIINPDLLIDLASENSSFDLQINRDLLMELARGNSSIDLRPLLDTKEKRTEAVKRWLLEYQYSQAIPRASSGTKLKASDPLDPEDEKARKLFELPILDPESDEARKQQQFEERCAQIATGAQVVAGEKFLKEAEKIKNAYEQLNALSSRLRKEIPTQLGDEIKNLTFRAESLIPKFQEISKVKHTYDMARSQAVQKPNLVQRITELQKLKEKFDNDFIKAKNEFLEAVEMVRNTRNKAIAELESSEPTH